jgi:hypothetical protein
MALTQYQKIVTLVSHFNNKWFLVSDFQRNDLGDYFVGYKASARINELEHDYPDMFLRRPNGRFVERKINQDEITKWFPTLTKDLRQIVAKQLNYYPHIPNDR